MDTTKISRAEKIYQFIVDNVNAGRTVTLWTQTRGTSIKKKHLPMVKVEGASLLIQSGKRWVDYTWVSKVTAE